MEVQERLNQCYQYRKQRTNRFFNDERWRL